MVNEVVYKMISRVQMMYKSNHWSHSLYFWAFS